VVLSKRERYVVIGTTLAIGLFVLDKMILGPVFDYRKQITTAVEDAQKKLEDNKRMFIMQGRSEKLWNQMVTTGGLKADQPTADQQLQVKMHDWIVERRPRSGWEKRDLKRCMPLQTNRVDSSCGSGRTLRSSRNGKPNSSRMGTMTPRWPNAVT